MPFDNYSLRGANCTVGWNVFNYYCIGSDVNIITYSNSSKNDSACTNSYVISYCRMSVATITYGNSLIDPKILSWK